MNNKSHKDLIMIYILFKTAFRFLVKNKFFTIINIIGLSFGITAFFLIILFLQNETGYESHIPEADRIYRLVGIQEPAGLDKQHVAYTSGGWSEIIKTNFPEAEDVFRLMGRPGMIVRVDDKVFREPYIFRTGGNIIKWFNYDILYGTDPANMLSEPNQAVISKEAAMKFFDSLNVVGNTFIVADKTYKITGVVDTENIKTHNDINVFLSLATYENELPFLNALGNNSLSTYIVLKEDASQASLENKINEHYTNWLEETDFSM